MVHELVERLAAYAAYHRNPDNIRTHFIGIPLIALGVAAFLYRFGFAPFGLPVNLATLAALLLLAYYVKLDHVYAIAMAVPLLIILFIASFIAALQTLPWAIITVILLVIGWAQQLIGHKHEGRKPAFLDDLRSIPIGPLFLLAEFGFKMGWRRDIQERINLMLRPERL